MVAAQEVREHNPLIAVAQALLPDDRTIANIQLSDESGTRAGLLRLSLARVRAVR